MSDLTDEELTVLRSSHARAGIADTYRMVVEIDRHRAARAASAERVREVVLMACIAERDVNGSLGWGNRIADRAAKQLAGVGVGLSASDRVRLQSIAKLLREQPVCWDMESALLDRLLASPPAPDKPSIPARPCYQDPARSTAWCAVHDVVPDWHSEISEYRGPAGWVCAAGGLFDNAKSAAASAEYDAKFAADPPPAPTAPVIAARDPASLTEDEIRVARTAARADQEELIGVVHSCSNVLRYGDRMGPEVEVEVEVASRRRIRDYIASKETVPIAAITALLDSDMPAGELRKALAEIVGL